MNQFGFEVDLNKTFIYVIDSSLGLSKGKIAAQVSHVAMMLSEGKVLGRSVVLKAPHDYFEFLCNQPDSIYVRDAGLTEVPAGTRTCVGFIKNESNQKLFKDLKLL
jgi:peptidyl-tRNA hydrolase